MTAPLDVDGPAAPPRSNGELVFSEPWESRAFGMAVSLHEAGVFAWTEFQVALADRIGAWESAPERDDSWNYYQLWLAALEDLLVAMEAVSVGEVTARAQALSERPSGHDHRADHDRHTGC